MRYLENHEYDGEIFAGVGVVDENLVIHEEKGNEDGEHHDILHAEEALVDHHCQSIPAEGYNEH